MLDPHQKEILEAAALRGQALHDRSLSERLEALAVPARSNLENFSILGLGLDFEGIKKFFEISEMPLSDEEHLAWLAACLEQNLLIPMADVPDASLRWRFQEDVPRYFASHSDREVLKRCHLNADRFLLERLASLAGSMGIALPEGPAQRGAVIGPYGFLYQIAHQPQYQDFHQRILNFAINWFDHLFLLEEYKEAADVLNHVCFALARRGQRQMAETMLGMVAVKTKGLTGLVARINLATLLREENRTSAAMRLYWGALPGLLRQRAFLQLAQVITEMAAIYRQHGHLARSAVVLELSVLLNRRLKNGKSEAIAHSQLSSTYRYLHLYLPALNNSRLAVDHFRKTNDLLNLGRSLLTQGNIHYNLIRTGPALECYDEALRIGRQIADTQATIGSTSGKARLLIFQKRYDEAQLLLEEAISLRERHNDHNVGIEYENMGALLERRGNIPLALGWYQKALAQFEKYSPIEVPRCRGKIAWLESRLRTR